MPVQTHTQTHTQFYLHTQKRMFSQVKKLQIQQIAPNKRNGFNFKPVPIHNAHGQDPTCQGNTRVGLALPIPT